MKQVVFVARWLVIVAGLLPLAACIAPATVPGSSPVQNLAGRCSQVEEDGYREDARIDIQDGRVQQLAWNIQVGGRGGCDFHLDQFRQTQSRPHIELLSRDGAGCKLLIYRDQRRVTLGHTNCGRQCTAGIADKAWPVMFDPTSGRCAALDR